LVAVTAAPAIVLEQVAVLDRVGLAAAVGMELLEQQHLAPLDKETMVEHRAQYRLTEVGVVALALRAAISTVEQAATVAMD
jgi:hypothetical protein